MKAAFAVGQIAGPIASSLLLHVPGFAQSGLNVALQVAAAAVLLAAVWLWRLNISPIPSNQEVSHAR
jgi:hypothetical protein